jgi:hypothetical protein
MELVTVTKGDTLVVKHVWAMLNVLSEPCKGSFNLPEAVRIKVGDRCQIETLDGRRATVVVESSNRCLVSSKSLREFPRPQTRVTFVVEGQSLS